MRHLKSQKRKEFTSCKEALDWIEKLGKKVPKRTSNLHSHTINEDYANTTWSVTWKEQ